MEIRCPIPKCDKEWEYGDIVSAADLDDKESTKLACVLENRALLKTGNFKECPQCASMLQKPDQLYMLRYVLSRKFETKSIGFFFIFLLF